MNGKHENNTCGKQANGTGNHNDSNVDNIDMNIDIVTATCFATGDDEGNNRA